MGGYGEYSNRWKMHWAHAVLATVAAGPENVDDHPLILEEQVIILLTERTVFEFTELTEGWAHP